MLTLSRVSLAQHTSRPSPAAAAGRFHSSSTKEYGEYLANLHPRDSALQQIANHPDEARIAHDRLAQDEGDCVPKVILQRFFTADANPEQVSEINALIPLAYGEQRLSSGSPTFRRLLNHYASHVTDWRFPLESALSTPDAQRLYEGNHQGRMPDEQQTLQLAGKTFDRDAIRVLVRALIEQPRGPDVCGAVDQYTDIIRIELATGESASATPAVSDFPVVGIRAMQTSRQSLPQPGHDVPYNDPRRGKRGGAFDQLQMERANLHAGNVTLPASQRPAQSRTGENRSQPGGKAAVARPDRLSPSSETHDAMAGGEPMPSGRPQTYQRKKGAFRTTTGQVSHVIDWVNLKKAGEEINREQFCDDRGISHVVFRRYTSVQGDFLTLRGKQLLAKEAGHAFTRITLDHIPQWLNRPAGQTREEFVIANNLWLASWEAYFASDGTVRPNTFRKLANSRRSWPKPLTMQGPSGAPAVPPTTRAAGEINVFADIVQSFKSADSSKSLHIGNLAPYLIVRQPYWPKGSLLVYEEPDEKICGAFSGAGDKQKTGQVDPRWITDAILANAVRVRLRYEGEAGTRLTFFDPVIDGQPRILNGCLFQAFCFALNEHVPESALDVLRMRNGLVSYIEENREEVERLTSQIAHKYHRARIAASSSKVTESGLHPGPMDDRGAMPSSPNQGGRTAADGASEPRRVSADSPAGGSKRARHASSSER